MDNKITKSRLSAFLQYEWILIIIISVVAIIVWELAYTISGVRLTVGQQFKYYYDQSISSTNQNEFYNFLLSKNTFSYDVLEINMESLNEEYNVLSTRLSIQEGDVIITDRVTNQTDNSSRAKTIVDDYNMYSYDKLLLDAENYLKKFLKDGQTDVYSGELDNAKIQAHFLTRMRKDNRFRKQEQKDAGVKQEIERITKLRDEVKDFKKLLESDVENLFFCYTKYEQTYNSLDADKRQDYEKAYEREKAERPNARYGLNVDALTGEGKVDPSKYFKLRSTDSQTVDTSKDVVIMVFDFLSYQPDLQFESICFINSIVRECSDILDA